MMRLYCVRGAVCCDNTKDSVLTNVGNLIRELLEKNAVTDAENIVSIQFTMTPDVNVLNPATAFRKASLCIDTSRVPLFCSAEPVVAGMLDRAGHVQRAVSSRINPTLGRRRNQREFPDTAEDLFAKTEADAMARYAGYKKRSEQ